MLKPVRLFFFLSVVLFSGQNANGQQYLPFISTLRDTASFKILPPYTNERPPESISRREAAEDVAMLKYIIDNAFAGKDYWQSRGLKFDELYASLRKLGTGKQQVPTAEMEETIYRYFSLVNDAHTHIVGFKDREMVKNLRPYYASILLEKRGKRYLVVQSGAPSVRVGSWYLGPENQLFRTLSRNSTSQYLLGRQSTEPLTSLSFRFNTGIKALPLHPSRIGEIRYPSQQGVFSVDTSGRVPVVRSSSFSYSSDQDQLGHFISSAGLVRDRPAFIWNIMDNRGGDGYFPSSFITGFNGSSHERATILTLYSPVINQCYWPQRNGWIKWDEKSMKGLRDDAYPLDSIPLSKRAKIRRIREDKLKVRTEPSKTWEVEAEQPMGTNTYPGQTVLLVNHLTNSAANNAVAMVKTLKNGIIIGENTGSAYTFANVKYYALKNSRIKLWLPSVLLINLENKMERGFEPDYWLDSAYPESEVKKWLANPTSYQFKLHR